jgi:hypothetical protein
MIAEVKLVDMRASSPKSQSIVMMSIDEVPKVLGAWEIVDLLAWAERPPDISDGEHARCLSQPAR